MNLQRIVVLCLTTLVLAGSIWYAFVVSRNQTKNTGLETTPGKSTADTERNVPETLRHKDRAVEETAEETVSTGGFSVLEPTIPTYPIVDTNQHSCYDDLQAETCPQTGSDYYGQDAQYQGNTPAYTDNGDGTVTDIVTGLMWVKDPGSKQTYAAAVANIGKLTVGGYTDWRIPSIKELYSLIDFSGLDPNSTRTSDAGLVPFIDSSVFNFSYGDTSAGARIIDSQWVTSNIYTSTVMGGDECFFGVNFADGRIKCYPTATRPGQNGWFLRAVRENPTYGKNNFVDQGKGIVRDKATGLYWQQNNSGSGMFWGEALAYCETLTLGGRTDWRLPSAKELQSIVDYSRAPDTSNSPALDPIFASTSITNEAGQVDWPFYWTSTTHINEQGGSEAVYISFGRAMGNMSEFGGWIDVHGAGAQRSDPKAGVASDQENGHGPQGDARRSYNYVRCVRGGGVVFTTDTAIDTRKTTTQADALPAAATTQPTLPNTTLNNQPNSAPPAAQDACDSKTEGMSCTFITPQGNVTGTCRSTPDQTFACVP